MTAKRLNALVSGWDQMDRMSLDSALRKSEDPDNFLMLKHHSSDRALDELQSFLMGFYYKLLLPLVGITYLSKAEAFGSWGYTDVNFFQQVMMLLKENRFQYSNFHTGEWTTVDRPQILALTAYMFAGAEQISINDLIPGAIGVLAKLSLVTRACLGAISSLDGAGKFFLMDVDTTCFPSNARGVVLEGIPAILNEIEEGQDHVTLDKAALVDEDDDYSVHIEPD